MKRALHKDFWMEVRKSKARFISIFCIVALGVAFFSGIQASSPDMRYSGDAYFDAGELMDIKVVGTMGLTEADVEAIREIRGVEGAEGAWAVDTLCSTESSQTVVHVESINETVNRLTAAEGRIPEKAGECFLDSAYAKKMGYEPGDSIILSEGEDSELLKRKKFTVAGIGSSPLYISFDRGNTTLGSGEVDGFAYVLPEDFDQELFTQVYVSVHEAAGLISYSDEYENLIEKIQDRVEDIQDERCRIRYEEIVAEAQEELADAEQELADAEKEAQEELADAEKELADGEKELADGRQEYKDGKKELADARKELADGRKELADARKELEDGKSQLADAKKQVAEGWSEIGQAREQLASGKAEFRKGEKKLNAGKKELEKGQEELDAGKARIQQAEAELNAKEGELSDAKSELETGKAQIRQTSVQLDTQKQECENALAQIAEAEAQLPALRAAVEGAQAQVDALQAAAGQAAEAVSAAQAAQQAAQAAYEQAQADFQAGAISEEELAAAGQGVQEAEQATRIASDKLSEVQQALAAASEGAAVAGAQLSALEQAVARKGELQEGLAAIEAGYAQIEEKKAEIAEGEKKLQEGQAAIAEGRRELDAQKKKLVPYEKKLKESKKELKAGQKELDANRKKLEAAQAEIDAGVEKLHAAQAEIDANEEKIASGEKEIADNEAKLADGEKEIADGEKELKDAKKKLKEGEEELKDGRKEYEDAKKEAEEKIADGREEIEDARKEIAEIKEPEWMISDRSALPEYSDYGDNADRIRNLGQVFPVIFFLVAALISLTTMTRMVEEQRTQIGTMKALGYGKYDIASKYLNYAFLATVGGSVFGILIGEKILPYIIITAYGIMYHNMATSLQIPYEWKYALLASVAAVICTVGATLFSTYKVLTDTPASLMRPPAPKDGKRVLVERITFLWKHLSFSWKSTLRNLFRYKKRLCMTIFGISGSMALMLVGYGIKDSISDIADRQYSVLQHYDGTIIDDEDASDEERRELQAYLEENEKISQYTSVHFENLVVPREKASLNAYIYVPEKLENFPKDVTLQKRMTGEPLELTDEGAVISEKTASLLNLKEGDEIVLEKDHREYSVPVAGITENYMGHYVYMTEKIYRETFGEAPDFSDIVFTMKEEYDEDLEETGREILEYPAALSISYTKSIAEQVDRMLSTLGLVIVVLIISAGMLAFVVLYNLNNINITERKRELATLKVLGFYDPEVSQYVLRENILLTIFSLFIGSGLGVLLHRFVITTVEVDAVMFGRNIRPISFLYCALLTCAFSIIVNGAMHFKLRKIDMVESLKSVE